MRIPFERQFPETYPLKAQRDDAALGKIDAPLLLILGRIPILSWPITLRIAGTRHPSFPAHTKGLSPRSRARSRSETFAPGTRCHFR